MDIMIVLVPASVCTELTEAAHQISPTIVLRPYTEDGPDPQDLETAEAVLRWIAGKRYSDLVARGPAVRWLHTASAGVDHVLTPAVRAKASLTVTDSGPAFEIAISEFVLAWMLMIARHLPLLWERQKQHHWEWVQQDELFGKTVGIVGLGPIGQGVATRAKAFGIRTLGWRRRPDPVAGVDEILNGPDGLTRLLSESDFVVLAAALTDGTRMLLDLHRLAQMKHTAWLINIARGAMVDEPALIQALQTGQIAGACLDVFAREPLPPDSPLWNMPNVYIAPHSSSGWTTGLQERQKQMFLQNLQSFVHHQPLQNVVDPAQGY